MLSLNLFSMHFSISHVLPTWDLVLTSLFYLLFHKPLNKFKWKSLFNFSCSLKWSSSPNWKDLSVLSGIQSSEVFHLLCSVTPFWWEKEKGTLRQFVILPQEPDETVPPCFFVSTPCNSVPEPNNLTLVPFHFTGIYTHPYKQIISYLPSSGQCVTKYSLQRETDE